MSTERPAWLGRRALLVNSIAAAAGAVAASLGRAVPVSAGSDGDVVLGGPNTGAATTSIGANLSGATLSISNDGSGAALDVGGSGTGAAIIASGQVGIGGSAPALVVSTNAGTGPAVKVLSEDTHALLLNNAETGASLLAYSGVTPPVDLPVDVAVHAVAVDSFVGAGVGPSRGVVASAPTGVGVQASTSTGIALQASAGATGTAIWASGKLRFSRSGRVAIGAGHSSRTITMAGVTTASYVIATPQTNRSGVVVQAVVTATGRFTIYLNKVVPGTTYVGYLVVN